MKKTIALFPMRAIDHFKTRKMSDFKINEFCTQVQFFPDEPCDEIMEYVGESSSDICTTDLSGSEGTESWDVLCDMLHEEEDCPSENDLDLNLLPYPPYSPDLECDFNSDFGSQEVQVSCTDVGISSSNSSRCAGENTCRDNVSDENDGDILKCKESDKKCGTFRRDVIEVQHNLLINMSHITNILQLYFKMPKCTLSHKICASSTFFSYEKANEEREKIGHIIFDYIERRCEWKDVLKVIFPKKKKASKFEKYLNDNVKELNHG